MFFLQSDGDSMSGSVRGRRVTDPTPVIRAPPGNEQLDPGKCMQDVINVLIEVTPLCRDG